ncbi:MAG: homoserine O-acetyltransferase [Cyclobacteriaceae bacterium]|nr:homoserine O-acetyltransferase [Cyclobacteriaceae bacterium]
MIDRSETYRSQLDFTLESGEKLATQEIAYRLFGNPKGKVVWICHALTGNQYVEEWWSELVGEGKTFDPSEYLIVCANSLGSCYGSSGPTSLQAEGDYQYFHRFPLVSTRDAARFFELLREHLNINHIHCLIGGSLGCQQALEWSRVLGEKLEKQVLIAGNAFHSAWGTAFNESQRMAIRQDPCWIGNHALAGKEGLKVARSIAMLSYRTASKYNEQALSNQEDPFRDAPAASYQRYQGQKLADRFNAISYYRLTQMMDSHNLLRGYDSAQEAFAPITAESLVIGISSDILFPISEQKYLAEHLKDAHYREIITDFGHDGFLVEYDQLERFLAEFGFERKQKQVAL